MDCVRWVFPYIMIVETIVEANLSQTRSLRGLGRWQGDELNKTVPNESDYELLAALRVCDETAMDRLVERFSAELSRAAFLFLGSAHMAEDVVQETFLAVWHGVRRARPDTKLRPWLFGILFNQCRKFARSRRRRAHRERVVAEAQTMGHDRQHDVDERLDRLQAALAGLAEPFRSVVILRYERGCSVAETAEALGVPQGTVMSRTHAGIRKLRSAMGQDT